MAVWIQVSKHMLWQPRARTDILGDVELAGLALYSGESTRYATHGRRPSDRANPTRVLRNLALGSSYRAWALHTFEDTLLATSHYCAPFA